MVHKQGGLSHTPPRKIPAATGVTKILIRLTAAALIFLPIVVARRAVVHLFRDAAAMRSSVANRREQKRRSSGIGIGQVLTRTPSGTARGE
jgi:hypothetical protein